jgi:hypothetical protein
MPTSRRIPHRCTGKLRDGTLCRKRHSFKHVWDTYLRKKKCSCGSETFAVDTHRLLRKDRSAVCDCDGYSYPHYESKNMVWCRAHPTGPSEEDQRERSYF